PAPRVGARRHAAQGRLAAARLLLRPGPLQHAQRRRPDRHAGGDLRGGDPAPRRRRLVRPPGAVRRVRLVRDLQGGRRRRGARLRARGRSRAAMTGAARALAGATRGALLAALAAALGCGCGAGGGEHGAGGPGAGADGGAGGDDGADAGPVTSLEVRYTEHLGQLTGTALNPVLPLGLSGTDLGVAFARDGKVALLFGDAWIDNRDQMALAPLQLPERGVPRIEFATGSDGLFQPLAVSGVDLGAFNVPVEGVPAGDLTYYFFSTGYSFDTGLHSHSVLAHGEGLAIDALELDHVAPSEKFINVQVVVEGDQAWIFGSGPYRKSPVYLARVELASIADRAAWTYYPSYVPGAGEESAEPLIAVGCVGELSVRRHPATGLLLMAYNCGEVERGIHLRTARAPEGPWSEPQLIYTPEMGYQHFMHARESAVGHDD